MPTLLKVNRLPPGQWLAEKIRLLVLVALLGQASAQTTLYWDTNGNTAGAGTANATWAANSGAANRNWTTNSAGTANTSGWTNGGSAVFSAGSDNTGAFNVTIAGTPDVNGITVEEGSPNISGSSLNFTGTNPFINVGTGRSMTISSTLTGTAGLLMNGAGTLTLSGATANTISGGVTVGNGTVLFSKTAGTNAVGTGTLNIGDGAGGSASAVLRLGASNQISNSAGLVTISSDGTLQLNNFSESINTLAGTGLVDLSTSGYLGVGVGSGSSTFGGTITGTGTFAKLGTGTLTLTNSISFGGTFELAGGTLLLGNMTLDGGTLLVSANSTIDFGGSAATLDFSNLSIGNGVTLTIQNWTDATDYFFTQNWAGAVYDTGGAAPMNQVVFSGFGASATQWRSFDNQITPVPEPSTYGALLLAAASGLLAWRRSVRRSAD